MEQEEQSVMAGQTPERPTFLTVLCILTFIGSGLGLLGGAMGLIVGSTALSFLPGAGGKTLIGTSVALASAIFCLWGAIRMWSLHKQGFTLYVIGAILSIAGAIINVTALGPVLQESIQNSNLDMDAQTKAMSEGFMSVALWSGVVWSVIINALFVILYGVNRKHLVY